MAALDSVVIKITGDSKDLEKTIKQLEKVGKVDRQNATSFKRTAKTKVKALDSINSKATKLGATLLGAFAIQAVVRSAVGVLKDFEKELSTLQSITGSTKKEMEFFAQAAKDVGKATKTSATEVVKAFTQIGSAQPELLKNGKALAEVSKQALILSKAAGIDATEAAKALTGAMNQYGAKAKDAAKFTDIFATSQQKGSSFISATSEALKNVGATANAAGVSFETTNAAIQALAKGALTGSEAGTALRGVLAKLSSQSDNKINPSMVGLGKTVDELAERNLSLSDAIKLVGLEGATGLLTLIKQNKTFKELDGNLNEVGNAMKQMETNTDNLDGSILELGLGWDEFILSLNEGSGVLGGLIRNIVDLGTESLELLTILAGGLDEYNDSLTRKNIIEQENARLTRKSTEEQQKEALALFLAKEAARKLAIELAKAPKTIGDLKKEMTALKKAQNDMIPGSRELAENQARIKEIMAILKNEVEKTLSPMELLNKRINEMKKELEAQALAGNISNDLIKEYKDAVRKAEKAQADLNKAMEDTLKLLPMMNTELSELFISDTPMVELTTDLEDFFTKYQDGIDTAIQAEQQLFGIIAQINTNKLIGIDNAETKALRALDAEGLGEQELAAKRQEIQEKASEERAKILTKQAKADKTAAIFDATINTAAAVTKALSVNPIYAAIIGALGVAEIATIAAQPIPVFHTGKKPELAEGEMFAKILKSESVIPPEQSKKYKGAIDSMIDKNFERYVYDEYMLPMMKSMGKKDNSPYDDIHIWNNQRKQIKLTSETNHLLRSMTRTLEPSNRRRSWN